VHPVRCDRAEHQHRSIASTCRRGGIPLGVEIDRPLPVLLPEDRVQSTRHVDPSETTQTILSEHVVPDFGERVGRPPPRSVGDIKGPYRWATVSGARSGSCLGLDTGFGSSTGGREPRCDHEPKLKFRAPLKQPSQASDQGAQTPSSLQYAIKCDSNIPHSSGESPYKRMRTLLRSNGTSSMSFAMRMTSFRRLCASPSS
jgi:hypothetical protein